MATVLILDGDLGVAEVLEGVLVDAGYVVERVVDSEIFLRRLAEGVPDAVFLDLAAPGFDGPGLLRAMQSEPAWASIPVVVMSALPEEAIPALSGGNAAFLRKPFRVASVLAALRRALRRQD